MNFIAKNFSMKWFTFQIEDDWCADRQIVAENEADDDILPLDMLDADIDWENSAFASKIRRIEKSLKLILLLEFSFVMSKYDLLQQLFA